MLEHRDCARDDPGSVPGPRGSPASETGVSPGALRGRSGEYQTDIMTSGPQPFLAAAIVTGGSFRAGREVALALAAWAWPTVVVYLHDQARADATVAEIIAAGGTTVAVRADLFDRFDVERLFDESITAFGAVDVVVHATADAADVLLAHAAQRVNSGGLIVIPLTGGPISYEVVSLLRERRVAIERPPLDRVVPFLDHWRQKSAS